MRPAATTTIHKRLIEESKRYQSYLLLSIQPTIVTIICIIIIYSLFCFPCPPTTSVVLLSYYVRTHFVSKCCNLQSINKPAFYCICMYISQLSLHVAEY